MSSAHFSSNIIETELKYALTKTEYNILKKQLDSFPHKTQLQTNYYFDSLSLRLQTKKIGLRIRTSGSNPPVLTLKFPKPSKKSLITSLKIRYEYEANLSIRETKDILAGKKRISTLSSLPLEILKTKIQPALMNRLINLGSLQTQRTLYRYSHGQALELDQSKFFNQKFYELEVETTTPRKTDRLIKKIFTENGIKYRAEKISKLERFLKEWKKQKKT